MTFPNFPGVCYSYDMTRNTYTTNTNKDNFQWDWTSSKVKGSRKWDIIGFMGSNILFNNDGVVFSTPFARSFPQYGGESGTIVLKKGNDDEFIVADGKWRKPSTDNLQNLAGTAIAKGNFYGSTGVERSR